MRKNSTPPTDISLVLQAVKTVVDRMTNLLGTKLFGSADHIGQSKLYYSIAKEWSKIVDYDITDFPFSEAFIDVILWNDEETVVAVPVNYHYLRAAVVQITDEIDDEIGHAGSDNWVSDTRFRRTLLTNKIRNYYCKLTGVSNAMFPFHSDFILSDWLKYRKLSTEHKQSIITELANEGLLTS